MAVLLMVPAIGIPGGIPGGITGGITARADAPVSIAAISLSGPSHGESTYLSLTRERMRQQLAAGDLESAARTLQWIRKIDSDDAVASVLDIELQLRRGNVAAAAMRLIEVLDGSQTTDATRAEAQRILALLAQEGSGAAVMVTRAMLDEANLPDATVPLLLAADGDGFAYEIGTSPPGDNDMPIRIRRFSAATPLDEMRAAMPIRMP